MCRNRLIRAIALLCAVILFGAACQSAEHKFQEHLATARAGIQSGEYNVARIELLNAIKINSSSRDAYVLLGQALVGLRDFRGAAGALAMAYEIAPDDRVVALQFSQILYSGKAYAMAESMANSWIQDSPRDKEFLFLLSMTQVRQGKGAGAVQTAEKAVDFFPSSADAWLNLARVHQLANNLAEAEAALSRSESIDPDSVAAAMLRGELLKDQGNLSEAGEHMMGLVENYPERADLKLFLAQLNEMTGKKTSALKLYQEVSEKEASAPVLYRMGVLLYETGQKDDALKTWENGIELDPYFVDSRLGIANHYFSENGFEKAEEHLNEALKFTPLDSRVLALRGKIYFAGERWDEAAIDFSTSIKQEPVLEETKLLLAQAYLKMGRIVDAKGYLKEYLKTDANHPFANFLFAKIEAGEGTLERSSRYARAASRDSVYGREAMWILGDNNVRRKMLPEAKELHVRNLDRHGPHIGTRYRLARCRDLLGEFEQAEADYRSMLKDHPDHILPLASLVGLLGQTGREDQALVLAREKARLGISHQLLLGKVLEKTGDTAQARELYFALIQSRPDLMTPYQRIVSLYAMDSDLDGAQEVLSRSIAESDTPQPRLMLLLGMVLDVLNNKEEAIKTYREALNIKPDFVPVMNNLAWNLSESGDLGQALEIASRARKLAPDDPSLADTYGWVLHQSGDSAGALPALRQAVEALPENQIVRAHLVEVLQAAGRTGEADRQLLILREKQNPGAQ